MCGIWGYLSKTCEFNQNIKDYECAFNNVRKRGPDRSNLINIKTANNNMLIGFHRLAIMDTSVNGDQPFKLELDDRTIYVMCNGEIYNYQQLTEKYNLELHSHSDCEILPLLYVKFGFIETVKLLKGEFALVAIEINNVTNKITVCLARDELGVRPLYICEDKNGLCFSSILSGFVTNDGNQLINESVRQMLPMSCIKYTFNGNEIECKMCKYDSTLYNYTINSVCEAEAKIRQTFENAVISRLQSDRPLGCLLSGGLDSSLVVSIASRYLRETKNQVLKTFSIGMEGSTDEKYALSVSQYCQTDHQHIILDENSFYGYISQTIQNVESYDTTTIRASVGNMLACKWISENTNIKVLLIGDGADELCGGYLYFHKAPTSHEFNEECKRLLYNIYMYDGQRADRSVSSYGLEARVPYLDWDMVKLYMSISPSLRIPINGLEKWLLRKSFTNGYLPDEVLYRRKEAFSDGVSKKERSWHTIIQEKIEEEISDDQYTEEKEDYVYNTPISKESLYYRKLYHRIFGKKNMDCVINRLWLPKKEWVGNVTEASARALSDLYTDYNHTMICDNV